MMSANQHAAPDPTRALVVRSAMAVAIEVPALLLAQEPGLVGRFGLVLAIIAVISPRFGRGPVPGPLMAGLIHLMGLVASLGVFMLIEPMRPSFGRLLCLGCLGIATPRLWFGGTRGSRTLVLGFGLMALMGLARATDKPAFGIAVGLYLIAGLIATLRADPIWPRLFKHKRGLGAPMLITLTLAGGIMVGLAWALPAAEPVVSQALAPWLSGSEAHSGFGAGSVRLGQLAKINTSDRLVLRVHGQTDYLRGQVYLDYTWGHWNRRAQFVEERSVVDGRFVFDPRPPTREVRIEAEPDAALALFAPLHTARITDAHEDVLVDQYGIARVPQYLQSEPLVWTVGLSDAPPSHVDPPTERDLALVEAVRPAWIALAAEWAPGDLSPAQTIAAFVARFRQDFRYSLELPIAPKRADPVLHFATQARYGHCEYFASALIMLARSRGIPARLATGYRVFEQSGNGWAIVRDRDAHAWAEIWLDGRWQTVEPTPPGSLAGERLPPPGWWATQWDAFKRALRRAVEWLGDLTARELVPVGVLIIALVGLLIMLRRRRAKLPPPVAPPGFMPLAVLEDALERKGVRRAPHQTLRQFARVVREAGHAEAATLIERCARFVYAQRGDADAIAEAVRRWAA